ncbi:MAG: PaaI family thioesterase [Pseudomonadota bacterium]
MGNALQGAFAPQDPDFAQAVAASFANQGFMTTLGARLETVEPGHVVITLPYSDAVGQQNGFFHGAAIGGIGDNAAGYAAMSLMPPGSDPLTVEYKINFIRPALGTLLRADGQVLRAGRSLTVARVDVSVVSGDGPDAPVALLQATISKREPR